MNENISNDASLRAFSVSELSFSLKKTLEDTFSYVRVKGEISGCKVHSSGHIYFSLKDPQAILDAVCWKGVAETLSFKPEDGMEVLCNGRITTYIGRSKYQLMVMGMAVSGQGALLKILEDRKKKLAAQGLFESSRKKPLPFFPQTIGIITSPTGAVIRDILHRLEDRLPTSVVVWPVAVQGAKAAEEIASAIRGFNALPPSVPCPDLLIVARGGGSVEDLWAFNEEEVVLAAASSKIPLISAVGHETDVTLIDYVADRRAPTPTGAAEMAVPVRSELLMRLLVYEKRLLQGLSRSLEEGSLKLKVLEGRLPPLSRILQDYEQRLDEWSERLLKVLKQILEKKVMQGQTLFRLLESYSYRGVLKRGFVLVKGPKGNTLTHAAQVHPGLEARVFFQDGDHNIVFQGTGPLGTGPLKNASAHKGKKGAPPKKQLGFWD